MTFVFFISALGNTLAGQTSADQATEIVSVQPTLTKRANAASDTLTIQLALTIKEGWHINSHKPLDEFLIPTEVRLTSLAGTRLLSTDFDEPVLAAFSFSETKLSVFEHSTRIEVDLLAPRGTAARKDTIKGSIFYQACNDASCLAPAESAFSLPIELESLPVLEQPLAAIQSPQNEKEESSSETDIVEADIKFSLTRAYVQSRVDAAIILNIKNGWHINSDKPLDEFLIATTVTFDKTQPGITLSKPVFPPEKRYKFSFSDEELSVFEGTTVIRFSVDIAAGFQAEDARISGTIHYQACNDASCLAPASLPFSASIQIADISEGIAAANTALFQNIETGAPDNTEASNEISGLIHEKGMILAFIFIFIAGLALNLTPCVYPLIPITISFFSNQAHKNTGKSFSLALVYILGMSVTYSAMGVFAASSGSLFGSLLQNPIVLIFIAAVMVVLATSMFGVWELTMPQKLNQLAGGSRQGLLGSLFMGLTVGIVAAPCIGPFVLGLLTYVSTVGDPVLGFWMFFTLSMGLGLPYLILGTFSGAMQSLPRSGMWMVWVKKVFGVILLAMAAYFLEPILPHMLKLYLFPALLMGGGIYVGFIEKTTMSSASFPTLKKVTGILFLAVALWTGWPEAKMDKGAWETYSAEKLQIATETGKPVIIDFTADWCIACKELEKLTFPSEPVVKRRDNFLLLRADLTKFASPAVEEIKKQYKIRGLPTVIFLDQKGVEDKSLRVIGFVNGDDFAARMDKITDR